MHKYLKGEFQNIFALFNIQVLIDDLSDLQKQSHNALVALDHELVQIDCTKRLFLLLGLEGCDELLHFFVEDARDFVDEENVVVYKGS